MGLVGWWLGREGGSVRGEDNLLTRSRRARGRSRRLEGGCWVVETFLWMEKKCELRR